MKVKSIERLILLVCFSTLLVFKGFSAGYMLPPPAIDTSDKVVLDFKNAKLEGNYVDIPVYFIANDFVFALDLSMRINHGKLTFDSVINYKSYLTEIAYYNPSDKTLRLTASASTINNFKPIENFSPLFALRFHFNIPDPCNRLLEKDIYAVKPFLNGEPCSIQYEKLRKLDFTYGKNNRACVGENFFSTQNNVIVKDTAAFWSWDFGNGITSNLRNPIVNFGSEGSYSVKLIATSNSGCSDTIQKVILVNETPAGSFTYASDCSSGQLMFTDLSAISSPNKIVKWEWDFGDKKPIVQSQNPTYNYELGGVYTVAQTVTSDSGCTFTRTADVVVDLLNAYFKFNNSCIGKSATFTDSSTSTPTSGAITNWRWDFGDGVTNILKNPKHIYNSAGIYNVSLVVSNANCYDSISKQIRIENKPIPKFTADKITGCTPLTVVLSDSSIIESKATYVWKFNDLTDSLTSKTISHTFTESNSFTVKQIVTTSAGCTDSLEKKGYITAFGNKILFSSSPTIPRLPEAKVKFQNYTTGYNFWLWNFGDSIYSSDTNPEHLYTTSGKFNVCLTGSSFNGCASKSCDSITVLNANKIAIATAFTPNGDNVNDYLKVRGGPIKEMDFKIFNQWGNLVFASASQADEWDGKNNGVAQPAGAYEYSLKGKTEEEELIDMHGIVNLIK